LQAPPRGLVESWTRFWLAPVPVTGLHSLRVLAGLLFLVWLLTLAGEQAAFFGLQGWVDRQAYVEMSRLGRASFTPGWSILYMAGSSAVLLNLLFWGAVGVLVLFTLGAATRVTAVLTWIVVVSFTANPITRYEADYLLGMLAFYLMIGYLLLGQWSGRLSLGERLLGPKGTWLLAPVLGARKKAGLETSSGACLAVRLLQIHFVLVVAVNGLHKLQFARWWAGVALWFPLHPPFETTLDSLRAAAASKDAILFFLSLAGYLVLAWQIGFPLFAWRKSCRLLLLGGAAVAWLGCYFVLKLPLYGPIFLVASLSYLTPAEWRWIWDKLAQAATRLAGGLPAQVQKKAPIGAKG
jgi:hypothetical protein